MKILETHIQNDKIFKVRYFDEYQSVQTEGYLTLNTPMNVVADMTEEDVVKYLENDSKEAINLIKSRLQEQSEAVLPQVRPPWLGTETFKVAL